MRSTAAADQLEREIDEIVIEIYGLMEEEMEIVEGIKTQTDNQPHFVSS